MSKKQDTRQPLYIVHTIYTGHTFPGDKESWCACLIARPLLNIPVPVHLLTSEQEGRDLAAQINLRPVCLTETITRDISGYVTYDVQET